MGGVKTGGGGKQFSFVFSVSKLLHKDSLVEQDELLTLGPIRTFA